MNPIFDVNGVLRPFTRASLCRDSIHPGHFATGHVFKLSVAGPLRNVRPLNISSLVKAAAQKAAAAKKK